MRPACRRKVLSLAVVHGHETLILGAWGCGVFANDPEPMAAWFADHLTGSGLFHGAFRRVVFAVLDRTPARSTLAPFEKHFLGSERVARRRSRAGPGLAERGATPRVASRQGREALDSDRPGSETPSSTEHGS